MGNITLKWVDLGSKKIQIPVADLQSKKPGKTILITGGMDGDEYAGIEAAYKLIDIYSRQDSQGRLIIVPIVNIPGFESVISWNPMDDRFPKHVLPGKPNGSPTEQLMFWLFSNYLTNVDLWIDLHSGAISESLQPFVRAQMSGDRTIDEQTMTVLRYLAADIVLYQHEARNSHAEKLAKHGTSYIVFESGQLGLRDPKDIDRHVQWTRAAISAVNGNQRYKEPLHYFQKLHIYNATKNALWFPEQTGSIKRGVILGRVVTLDGKKTEKIVAKEDGVFLWGKQNMPCKKGDELIAIAYDFRH